MMPSRLAACSSLIVFAFCLLLGMRAQNTFATTLARALIAMAGTFAIGLAVGCAAQRMVDENVKSREQKLKEGSSSTGPDGR